MNSLICRTTMGANTVSTTTTVTMAAARMTDTALARFSPIFSSLLVSGSSR